MNNVTAYFELS